MVSVSARVLSVVQYDNEAAAALTKGMGCRGRPRPSIRSIGSRTGAVRSSAYDRRKSLGFCFASDIATAAELASKANRST